MRRGPAAARRFVPYGRLLAESRFTRCGRGRCRVIADASTKIVPAMTAARQGEGEILPWSVHSYRKAWIGLARATHGMADTVTTAMPSHPRRRENGTGVSAIRGRSRSASRASPTRRSARRSGWRSSPGGKLPDQQPHDVARPGAQHLADADLLGAPLGGEGGKAEQAEAADHHREDREGGEWLGPRFVRIVESRMMSSLNLALNGTSSAIASTPARRRREPTPGRRGADDHPVRAGADVVEHDRLDRARAPSGSGNPHLRGWTMLIVTIPSSSENSSLFLLPCLPRPAGI